MTEAQLPNLSADGESHNTDLGLYLRTAVKVAISSWSRLLPDSPKSYFIFRACLWTTPVLGVSEMILLSWNLNLMSSCEVFEE